MTLIFDEEDGLGFYVDDALARQAFADPRLLCAQPYRGVISGCLRAAGVSPVPHSVDRVFRTSLNKPKACWDHEALLRRLQKPDSYAEPL